MSAIVRPDTVLDLVVAVPMVCSTSKLTAPLAKSCVRALMCGGTITSTDAEVVLATGTSTEKPLSSKKRTEIAAVGLNPLPPREIVANGVKADVETEMSRKPKSCGIRFQPTGRVGP